MKEKTIITVHRNWNKPKITTTLNAEGITLTMDGEDFRIALLKEIGPVAMVFKQATFESMVNKAFENVIEGIKEESAKIV